MKTTMKTAAAAALTAAFASAASAEIQYWNWNEQNQSDRRFSTASNWKEATAPASDLDNTEVALVGGNAALADAVFTVDAAGGFALRKLAFGSGLAAARLTGDALVVKNSIYAGTPTEPGADVVVDVPVFYAGEVSLGAEAGRCVHYTKLIRNFYEEQDHAAKNAKNADGFSKARFIFNGEGTNFVDGGIYVPYNNYSYNYNQPRNDGNLVVRSDVYLPYFHMETGFLRITDGATMRCFAPYDDGFNAMCFLRGGRIEIENGALILNSSATAQQSESYSLVIDVRDNGVFDTGTSNFRSGNDGAVTYNLYDGGTIYWRVGSWLAEKGSCVINLHGGRLVFGANGTGNMYVGRYGLQLPDSEDEVNLFGGTLCVGRLSAAVNTSDAATRHSHLRFDGGRIVAGLDGDFTPYVSSATADTFRARLRAGGLFFDTAGHAVSWTTPLLASDVDGATGALVKEGAGTFTLAASCAGDVVVKKGTFAVPTPAHLEGRAVSLRPQGVFVFGSAATDAISLSSLSSKYGIVRLVCGAENAAQKVTLSGACDLSEALVFDLQDTAGAAFGTDGTYALVEAASFAGDVSTCFVRNPVDGKSYTFAVDDGVLSVTIADGAAPAAPVFPDVEDEPVVLVQDATFDLASDAALPDVVAGGTLSYAGAEARSVSLAGVVATAGATVSRAAGAGALTLSGPVVNAAGSTPTWCFSNGDDAEETIFSGSWFFPGVNDSFVKFIKGRFRFADGCSFVSQGTSDYALRFGGEAAGDAVTATLDAGASVSAAKLALGPADAAAASDPVSFVQKGGSFYAGRGIFGDKVANSVQSFTAQGGAALFGAGEWLNLCYGASTLAVDGGAVSADKVAFGNGGYPDVNYSVGDVGATRTIAVSAGSFEVRNVFSWRSDADAGAVGEMRLTGGTATLPVTVAPKRSTTCLACATTLTFDGGALAFNGVNLSGGSFDDCLYGLDSVSVGENGATFSVPAGVSATVAQPLRGLSRKGGDLVKTGAGALALAKPAVLFGAVDVREGTLAAKLEQRAGANTPVPAGALAYWDFDGDDPLADKSGHGYDLVQYDEAKPVAFTADAPARSGNGARWSGEKCAVLCKTIPKGPLYRSTSTAWFRVDSFNNTPSSYVNVFSTRPNKSLNGNVGAYDFTWKGAGGLYSCWGGDKMNYFPPSPISTKEWHHLAVTRDMEKTAYWIDGVNVANYEFSSYAKTYVVQDGSAFSIGMGIANGEFMAKDGMIDEVALYGRVLTAAEIAALYADVPAASANAVKIAAGATWDALGSTVQTPALSGGGIFTNGTLSVTGTIAPDPDGTLFVETLAVPEATGVFDLARDDDPLPQEGRTTLLAFGALDESSAANLAAWQVVNTGLSRRVSGRLEVDAANGRVDYVTEGIGTVLIIR